MTKGKTNGWGRNDDSVGKVIARVYGGLSSYPSTHTNTESGDLCGALTMEEGLRQAAPWSSPAPRAHRPPVTCVEPWRWRRGRDRRLPGAHRLTKTVSHMTAALHICTRGYADSHAPDTHSRNTVKWKAWLHTAKEDSEN